MNAFLGFQRLFIFFIAYGAFLLFAYKMDPRFSLKYRKRPSFVYLMWISTLETVILLLMLVFFNLLLGQDLIVIFGIDRLLLTQQEVLFGLVAGVLIFLLFLPIDASISALRRKFFPTYKSRREDEVRKLVFASLPKSPRSMFALLLTTSLKAAIFEEIIFRGYLLNNLLLLTLPGIAIQALLFFIPHLYQGAFNAILPLIGGFVFGLLFFITGSLTVVIVAHFTGDLIGLVIQATLTKKGSGKASTL
jgi:membrane protease YdiL (CAAX protease family)